MKAKQLVADTAAFVKNISLWDYAEEIVTVPEVMDEIRDESTQQHISAFPIQIQYRSPEKSSISFIINFAKKTGDYQSLSMTDIKVMALAYELDVAAHGNSSSHLRSEPERPLLEGPVPGKQKSSHPKLAGFYYPSEEESDVIPSTEELPKIEKLGINDKDNIIGDLPNSSNEQVTEDNENESEWTVSGKSKKGEPIEEACIEDFEDFSEDENDEVNSDSNSEDDENNDDDDGWITPNNIKKKKINPYDNRNILDVSEKETSVVCMTTDFAMQNVLRHTGLHVIGIDGKLIQHLKMFILRCYSCYRTTTRPKGVFCPKCGNKTLKKVSYSINPDGTTKIWINTKKRINTRGTKFSLPTFKSGKHVYNPILSMDQKEAKKMASKMSCQKTNPLHPDYDALAEPFARRDVYSRAANLGYQAGKKNHQMYWERRNPNEPMKTKHKAKSGW